VEAALERLLPRRHESERIEPEGLGRDAADDQVAMVNGVERSAEEAYHGPVDVIPRPADVIPSEREGSRRQRSGATGQDPSLRSG